jgi:Fe-S cluster biogenesis protein NfuA
MVQTLQDHAKTIERLVEKIRGAGDLETQQAALELLQAVMEFHERGIDRMLEIASGRGDAGWALIDDFGNDPLVSHLLLLHGLHPLDTETRVRDALDKVRPYLNSHGGDVQLISVAGDSVRLRLIGSCNGCPSSSLTLKTAVEKSVFEAAPEVTSIQTEGEVHGATSAVSISGAA